jgi:hypothetical protein
MICVVIHKPAIRSREVTPFALAVMPYLLGHSLVAGDVQVGRKIEPKLAAALPRDFIA